jgi:DNA-binding GntR family transcriptional regulator
MSPPLSRNTLKEQAYRALREMIVSHRFSAGGRINVEQLSKEMEVSRTPVWQALKDLETEGLVFHEPNRGIRMAQMTPRMAVDLYQVRGGLEALAASLAAELAGKECCERLERSLKAQVPIVKTGDLLAYSKEDLLFHSLIYEACGNWLLKELLENIKYRSRPLVIDLAPILPDLLEDHRQVVAAIKRRAREQAGEIMRRHNGRMRDFLAQSLNGQDAPRKKGRLPGPEPARRLHPGARG